jgi:hypothetical protein
LTPANFRKCPGFAGVFCCAEGSGQGRAGAGKIAPECHSLPPDASCAGALSEVPRPHLHSGAEAIGVPKWWQVRSPRSPESMSEDALEAAIRSLGGEVPVV